MGTNAAQTFEDWANWYSGLTEEALIGFHSVIQTLVPESQRALREELERRHIGTSPVSAIPPRDDTPKDDVPELADSPFWELTLRRAKLLALGLRDATVVIGCALLVTFFVWLIYWFSTPSYQWLDEQGYIAHTVDSTIVMKDNWLNGESRDCTSEPLNFEAARYLSKPSNHSLSRITCDDGGSPHDIKIKFYGSEIQPDAKGVEWRCTRDDDGFTCKETGTVGR
jgi:hypothetical protein